MKYILSTLLALTMSSPLLAERPGWGFEDEESWSIYLDPNPAPFIGSPDRPFELEPTESAADQSLMVISIEPAPESSGELAYLTIKNRLAPSVKQHEEYHFIVNEEVVIIVTDMGEGNAPDTFEILPPDGYVALPTTITLEEGEDVMIRIIPYLFG